MTFEQLLASLSIRDGSHLRDLVNTHGITQSQRHSVADWFGVPVYHIAPGRWSGSVVAPRADDRPEGVPA